MPTISDPANTRSVYPTRPDTLTDKQDGTGLANVVNAELWNVLETAILRTQEHCQQLVQTKAGDRRTVALSGTAVLVSTEAFHETVLALSAAQLAFLGGNLFRDGLQIYASATRYDSAETYRAEPLPVLPSSIKVRFDRLDTDANLSAGAYVLHVTLVLP